MDKQWWTLNLAEGFAREIPHHPIYFSFVQRLWAPFCSKPNKKVASLGFPRQSTAQGWVTCSLQMTTFYSWRQIQWNGGDLLGSWIAKKQLRGRNWTCIKPLFFFFSFFSWNTDATRRQEIITLSGLQATQRYDKYLGLLALVGKSRTQAFQCIKDKVRNQLNNWKLKFLYQSGK
jgi:hypothetical protein